jgi:curved DNA-binding protein CbpA
MNGYNVAQEINSAYIKLASAAHPDNGGSLDKMVSLNTAKDKGLSQ